MKASEEIVFSACDAFFAKHQKDPTGDDLLAMCGGGKKEILELRDRWRALRYLKENHLEVPTAWVAFLARFYQEVNGEIAQLTASRLEEVNASLETMQTTLNETVEEKKVFERKLQESIQTLEAEKQSAEKLRISLVAAEQHVGSLTAEVQKQSVEMSQKDLQLGLLKDQINTLQQEHLRELEGQKHQYQASIADKNELIKTQQQSNAELKETCEDLAKKLLIAETLRERDTSEIHKLNQGLALAKDNEIEYRNQLRELELKYLAEKQRSEEIPGLIRTIDDLKDKLINIESKAASEMLEQFKNLNESVVKLSKFVTPGSTSGRENDD